LVFGVPSTTELGSKGFDSFKSFVKKVTSSYPINERDTNVGIVRYGDRAEVILPLSQGKSQKIVDQRLDRMRYRSGTQNLPEALKLAGSEMFTSAGGGRKGSSKYFVFGGGSESNTPKALKKASKQLQYQGVSLMPIPIGVDSNKSPLKSIASNPVNNFYLPATDSSNLERDLHSQATSSIRPGKNLKPS
jgi:hypothetical protein